MQPPAVSDEEVTALGTPAGIRVFRSRRVVVGGEEVAAAVCVAGGRIQRVAPFDDVPRGADVIELGSLALLPGFVDSHVHINEPGRTEWEGFESATRAAAAGGVTTVVDMPLNSIPPTTTVAGLHDKLKAAGNKLCVDVAFWGGVVPDNLAELTALHEAGVAGFKCFLAPSGVGEFGHVSYAQMEAAMRLLARLDTPLLVHAEDPTVLARPARVVDRSSCAQFAATRPPEAELEAVRAVVEAAARTSARVHIVHASVPETLALVAAARDRGVRVTVETCPHYLWFAAEEVPAGAVEWKCAPPIRDACNRQRLQQALRLGQIDLVVSDHSPCPPEHKQIGSGDFLAAWGGIASLQIAPLVTWTVAAGEDCSLVQLSDWTSAAPARLAGLASRKGAIAAGRDADFVVLDPEALTVVRGRDLQHRHKLTPYDGVALRGRVVQTWLRGQLICDNGSLPETRAGQPLLRNPS